MNLPTLACFTLVVSAWAWVGCGGIAVIDGDGAGGAGGSSSTSNTSVTNVTATSSTGSGADALNLSVIDAFAFADCMPAVPPDPVDVDFGIDVQNTSPVSVGLSVLGARIFGPEGEFQFQVAPANVVIGGGSSQILLFEKIPGSASGDDACNLCGSINLTIELDLEIDGEPRLLEGPVASISCGL